MMQWGRIYRRLHAVLCPRQASPHGDEKECVVGDAAEEQYPRGVFGEKPLRRGQLPTPG